MTELAAIIFDQDGVLVDTERDGHRVAFNRAFAEFGLPVSWDPHRYHQLLQVGGGKERMWRQYQEEGFGVPLGEAAARDLVAALHQRKTDLFVGMLEAGELPLRPGVRRFLEEAVGAGLRLGICTTSHVRSAEALRRRHFPDLPWACLLAGDQVPRKKPDPAIYQLALDHLGLPPTAVLVVEDSHIGMRAARGAGLRVLATTNPYTVGEDLAAADWIVSCLGDPEGERAQVRKAPPGFSCPDGILRVEAVRQAFRNLGEGVDP